MFPKLYKYTTLGQVQQWQIFTSGNTYWTEEGIHEITKSDPTICIGKNINKSNETTPEQQAILEAQRQLAQQQAYQPLNVAERYGAGITPLIAGYPGREMTSITPSPSPLQNILGIGSTLAGIYGKINPAPLFGSLKGN